MSKQKTSPKTQPVGATSETAPIANPTGAQQMADLPDDAVALLVWRTITGPSPMTFVVTRASWDMNRKVVIDAGSVFVAERIYEFESPTNEQGRKTIFHFQGVVSWAGNIATGIVPAPKGLVV